MTQDELKHLEQLSALYIDTKEQKKTLDKLNSVVEYISILDNYQFKDNMEPDEQMTDSLNRWREDEAKPSISLEEALSNATRKNENFFKVPKVIE